MFSRLATTALTTLPGLVVSATRKRMTSPSDVRAWLASNASRPPAMASSGSHDSLSPFGRSTMTSV